jgi:hypothetical protein
MNDLLQAQKLGIESRFDTLVISTNSWVLIVAIKILLQIGLKLIKAVFDI